MEKEPNVTIVVIPGYHWMLNPDTTMILFPSFVYHKTSENNSDVPRISIAFDLITEEVNTILKNKNFILL